MGLVILIYIIIFTSLLTMSITLPHEAPPLFTRGAPGGSRAALRAVFFAAAALVCASGADRDGARARARRGADLVRRAGLRPAYGRLRSCTAVHADGGRAAHGHGGAGRPGRRRGAVLHSARAWLYCVCGAESALFVCESAAGAAA